MNIIKLLIFFILMSITAVLSVKIEPRIVGGRDANPTDFKYFAKITTKKIIKNKNKVTRCGGSVIDKNWILTAAHCIIDGITFTVELGLKEDNTYSKVLTSKTAIPHKSFSYEKKVNDVGLIKVPTIEYGDFIQKIPLSNKEASSLAGKDLTLVGLGKISSDLRPATKLQRTTLKVVSTNECKKIFKVFRDDQHICAFHPKSNSCIQDSGGPLVTDSGANAVQVGVVSFGKEKCTPGIPSVYVNVAFFLPWIKSETNISF